jgi:hypothetical protein
MITIAAAGINHRSITVTQVSVGVWIAVYGESGGKAGGLGQAAVLVIVVVVAVVVVVVVIVVVAAPISVVILAPILGQQKCTHNERCHSEMQCCGYGFAWIRIILGSLIRIHIKVEGWIRIRMKVKSRIRDPEGPNLGKSEW